MLKWSSFSLNPRAPEAEADVLLGLPIDKETDETTEDDAPANGPGPAVLDSEHEISDTILNADTGTQDMVPMSPSEADLPATSGRWDSDDLPPNWFSWKKLWKFTGPGFLMSIAYIVSTPLHRIVTCLCMMHIVDGALA